MTHPLPVLWTDDDVAAVLEVSHDTLRRLVRAPVDDAPFGGGTKRDRRWLPDTVALVRWYREARRWQASRRGATAGRSGGGRTAGSDAAPSAPTSTRDSSRQRSRSRSRGASPRGGAAMLHLLRHGETS